MVASAARCICSACAKSPAQRDMPAEIVERQRGRRCSRPSARSWIASARRYMLSISVLARECCRDAPGRAPPRPRSAGPCRAPEAPLRGCSGWWRRPGARAQHFSRTRASGGKLLRFAYLPLDVETAPGSTSIRGRGIPGPSVLSWIASTAAGGFPRPGTFPGASPLGPARPPAPALAPAARPAMAWLRRTCPGFPAPAQIRKNGAVFG